MYDKKLFEKIINLKCTEKELSAFCDAIDEHDYDTDEPFEKYFNAKRVRDAINACKDGKLSDEYLCLWLTAYCWILNGGFALDDPELITVEYVVGQVILSYLDSLSLFDFAEDCYDLYDFRDAFLLLDDIYHNQEWVVTLAEGGQYGDGTQFFAVNEKQKQYLILPAVIQLPDAELLVEVIDKEEFLERVQDLQDEDYELIVHDLYIDE